MKLFIKSFFIISLFLPNITLAQIINNNIFLPNIKQNNINNNLFANANINTNFIINNKFNINDNNEITEDDISIIDVDVFHGWDNPSVNCYNDVKKPLCAKLDVSEFVMPVNGKITSNFGFRKKFNRMHYGVDLNLNTGDTVRAAFSGVVRIVNNQKNGYGKYVVIRHSNGMETVYAHFSKHLVSRSQIVIAGQPIGLGGNTGRSTGPHLHFEIRFLGIPINPSLIVDFNNKKLLNNTFTFINKTK